MSQIWRLRDSNISLPVPKPKRVDELLDALKCGDRESPVAVSKALHLLAPSFFPMWDNDISRAYDCYWEDSEMASTTYLVYMEKMKGLSERIIQTYMDRNRTDSVTSKNAICRDASLNMPFTKSLLKIIDEYSYAFTKY
jgi:hypothetical protein